MEARDRGQRLGTGGRVTATWSGAGASHGIEAIEEDTGKNNSKIQNFYACLYFLAAKSTLAGTEDWIDMSLPFSEICMLSILL